MIANMKDKTGRTLDYWLAVAQKTVAEKHGAIVKALKAEPAAGRLERSGSFNAMVSHRVRLEKPADVDKDVKAWLKKAWADA